MLRPSLGTEVMGGMIRHVTVMGIMTSTICVPPRADIETALVLVLQEAMVDVVIAPLVVVIVPPTATMVAGVRGVKVKAEAEIIVNEAHRTAIVGVIVPDVKSKHCLLQVQSTSSMTMLFRLTTLRVGRMHFPPTNKTHTDNRTSPQPYPLRWWSHVSKNPNKSTRTNSNIFGVHRKKSSAESSINSA